MSERTAPEPRYLRVISNDSNLFWILHASGWLGISLITYLSLSLPYDQFEFAYLAHNLSQSVVGMMLSLPMRYLFQRIWGWRLMSRLLVIVLSSVVLSSLWAALRLLLFMLMTGESELWADFGGWLFPSIFVFLTWAALYHGIKYYQLLGRERVALLTLESQQRKEALSLAEAKAEAKNAQLALLRYQLNPHFLFNTLNSVMALISQQRTDAAQGMLGRLSDFLRFTLATDQAAMFTLKEELHGLSLYLDIEQVRFSDRLAIEYDIADEAKNLAVPSLLLQPLVENAIKYAIGPSERGGIIRISASTHDNQVRLSVEDSGIDGSAAADPRSADTDSTGIGLTNTTERLANVFGDDFTISVTGSPLGGLKFLIEIPATEVL